MCQGFARLFASLALLPSIVCAAMIHVPGEQPSIQAGIDAALAGDTVMVSPGVYEEWMIWMKSGVRLLSQWTDPSLTTIDGMERDTVFHCENVDASASIEGFTITRGNIPPSAGGRDWESGGGMHCKHSSLLIRNCVFTGNTANYGGGLACDWSDVTVEDCVFSNNHAFSLSGAADCFECSPQFTRCRFEGNRADFAGGAVDGWSASPRFSRCDFEGNVAEGSGRGLGGAVRIDGPTEAVFTDCRFTNNRCDLLGGAYEGMGGDPEFNYCVFAGNSARYGGAVILGLSQARFIGCCFTGNSALQGAAIYLASESNIALNFCTIIENTATAHGAALSAEAGGENPQPFYPDLQYCLIAYNGPVEAVYCDPYGRPALSCCDLYGNEGGDWTGYIEDQAAVNGNFSEDPQLCGIPGSGNYFLQSDSPCAAAGNDCGTDIGAYPVGCEETAVSPVSWSALKALY